MRFGKVISVLAATLLAASMVNAATEEKTIPWDQTGPFKHVDGSGPHRDSMNILAQARAAHLTAFANAAESRDVGDVAVIVDDGTLIIPPSPPNPYDIPAGTILTFTPGADAFNVTSVGGGAVAPGGAVPFPLGDDDSQPLPPAPFSFPFLGMNYGGAADPAIYMGSDGHITFGAADGLSSARDAARHIGGPPRISALFLDLDPTSGGFVGHEITATTITFSWIGVPQFGAADSNSFQAVLHDDGTIDLVYGAVSASVGVVGVAEGNNEPPFNELDMTADLPGTFGAGAIFEEFGPGNVMSQMNTLGVAEKFLESHPDEFDFIVIFTDFLVDIGGGAFAFHQGVQNQTFGLGLRAVFDDSASVGSAGELESVLNMNRIGLYWPAAEKLVNPPIKKFRFSGGAAVNGPPGPGQITSRARWAGTLNGDFDAHGSYTLGLNSAMSIMGQEAGHRWLAFPVFFPLAPPPNFDFPGDLFDLLGRADAHWSFFHNVTVPPGQFGGVARASSAEGNAIRDLGAAASAGLPAACNAGLGESTFLTEQNELVDGFTELDQYFMGLRSAASVSPFWYVDDPRSAFSGNSLAFANSFGPQDDVIMCGKRFELTVADITNAGTVFGIPENGPRIPAIGDENDAADNAAGCGAGPIDVKTMAFVVLVPGDPSQHTDGIAQVDTFRSTWQTYANGPATGGLGKFDTSLTPDCH